MQVGNLTMGQQLQSLSAAEVFQVRHMQARERDFACIVHIRDVSCCALAVAVANTEAATG